MTSQVKQAYLNIHQAMANAGYADSSYWANATVVNTFNRTIRDAVAQSGLTNMTLN